VIELPGEPHELMASSVKMVVRAEEKMSSASGDDGAGTEMRVSKDIVVLRDVSSVRLRNLPDVVVFGTSEKYDAADSFSVLPN
jgi:hypothetical protein